MPCLPPYPLTHLEDPRALPAPLPFKSFSYAVLPLCPYPLTWSVSEQGPWPLVPVDHSVAPVMLS